ncbi:MAG: endopeptidase La [Desulfobacter postgatei]|uniref:endopeptidase La n=1 Tax=Desulfobacter postgatei TaxID=2293 RepID=UPI0023F16121|nr:endopeptidase La [Desulfobacter postgatei]MDD4275024.1 endopeptidase La [Desulfobacter postgatei]
MISISRFFNPEDGHEKEKKTLPLVPLRDIVLFPFVTTSIFVGREKSIKALSQAMVGDKKIFLTTQKDPDVLKPTIQDLFQVGTEARITQLLRLPDGTVKALVEGIGRGCIIKMVDQDSFQVVDYVGVPEKQLTDANTEASIRTVHEAFQHYVALSGVVSKSFFKGLHALEQYPSRYADTIAAQLPFKVQDKQKLLECGDIEERFFLLLKFIQKETEVFSMSQKIKGRVKEQMDKLQKRHYLNEQMRAIRKEMGEDGQGAEFVDLEKRIKAKRMPKEAAGVVRLELEKLKLMSATSSEATVVRNYIDWLLSLPWYRKKRVKNELVKAEQILDRDHYGLQKPKERILEYLAVQILVKKIKGPILCLVGPPGVGKTSLARSVASATGRSFARISLGGVRDEAEIRGHRRTYVGAMPGKIIQTLKKVGYNNPVFCLDEIDKMTRDFRGDPSSALLEALDPEQNRNFNDHYLEVDYDLSEILFITTANTLHEIPAPLRDRMEVIQIPGYTDYEKYQIATGYLIPKQIQENGLDDGEIYFSKAAVEMIIKQYTKEAGVRNLERELSSVLRKIATEIVRTNTRKKYQVTANTVSKYLGQSKFRNSILEQEDKTGIVTGLAWTQAGGELLTIEAVTMPGRGKVMVTGKLGDVMKESAQAAVSYVRSRSGSLNIREDFYNDTDIHIHVPEGAIPKDGPSAGIAMCTAVVSILTGRPVSRTVAMTGEITLRGRVLPIGGLKEKLLAAHANGIKKVILCEENKKDIIDVPKTIQNQLDIVYVESMSEVLEHALVV